MISLSRTVLAAAIAATCLLPLGCGSADRAAPTSSVVTAMTPRSTSQVPFELSWTLQLPGTVERSWIGEQLPDLVFFQMAENHEIHCIDSRSGVTRWVSEPFERQILGEAFVHHLVMPGEREKEIIVDDRLYVVVDDTLYCLDIGTGQRIWHFVLPFAPSTGPMAAGASDGNLRVFIGDWNNRIHVIGMHQGTNQNQRTFPYVVWQMNLSGPVLSQPTESEEQVYATDSSGSVTCFKLDRRIVWEAATGGAADGGATTRGRVLYVGNDGNAVHALNRLTGERLGQFNLQGPVHRRPFWFAGESERLYVWVDSPDLAIGGLVALKAQPDNIAFTDGGKHAIEVVRLGEEWRVPGATRLVGSTPLHLMVGDAKPDLLWAVHRGTGAIAWTWDLSKDWPTKNAKVEQIVPYHDRTDQLRGVIALDDSGFVQAYRMFGFVPTPAQEKAGLTSRSLTNQSDAKNPTVEAAPKGKKPAAPPKAEQAPAEAPVEKTETPAATAP